MITIGRDYVFCHVVYSPFRVSPFPDKVRAGQELVPAYLSADFFRQERPEEEIFSVLG